MYTRPFAIVGGQYLAWLPNESRVAFCWEFHSSSERLEASKARSTPGTVAWLASRETVMLAQTMPFVAPFAEIERMLPGMALAGDVKPVCVKGEVANRPLVSR